MLTFQGKKESGREQRCFIASAWSSSRQTIACAQDVPEQKDGTYNGIAELGRSNKVSLPKGKPLPPCSPHYFWPLLRGLLGLTLWDPTGSNSLLALGLKVHLTPIVLNCSVTGSTRTWHLDCWHSPNQLCQVVTCAGWEQTHSGCSTARASGSASCSMCQAAARTH